MSIRHVSHPQVLAVRQPQSIVVDIDQELQYWRQTLPTSELRHLPLQFSDLMPTIKFGYDTYLRSHRIALAELLPELKQHYENAVPHENQLEWRWADQIIRHAWGRMLAA
jgi:hypothetical protein